MSGGPSNGRHTGATMWPAAARVSTTEDQEGGTPSGLIELCEAGASSYQIGVTSAVKQGTDFSRRAISVGIFIFVAVGIVVSVVIAESGQKIRASKQQQTQNPETGTMSIPPSYKVAAVSPSVLRAMETGNASATTVNELRMALASFDEQSKATRTLVSSLAWTTAFSYRITRTGAAASLSDVTWNPSHDSMLLTPFDLVNTSPLLVSNKNYKTSSSSSPAYLAIAGQALAGKGGRFVAYAGNPFHDMARLGSRPGGSGNAAFNASLVNTVRWLLDVGTTTADHGVASKIVIAHQPGASSYWFQHDVSTRAWFSSKFRAANVTKVNACDNGRLDACLKGAKLLVIGRQMGQEDDTAANSATTDASAVTADVAAFSRAGGSVLYVQYDGTANALSNKLFTDVFGISTSVSDNYWRNAGLLRANQTVSSYTSSPLTDTVRMVSSVFDGAGNASGYAVSLSEISPCITSTATTWASLSAMCTAGWRYKVGQELLLMRAALNNIDSTGLDLFGNDMAPAVYKLLVLLGDKARANVTYPFRAINVTSFVRAQFSDASVLYRRMRGPAQSDLGSLYCPLTLVLQTTTPRPCSAQGWDYRTYADAEKLYRKVEVTQSTLISDTWTTTGLFALPGRPFNVTRTDTNGSLVTTSLYLWFQRQSTTKPLEKRTSDAWSSYHRPQFARSPAILIPAGETVTISAPYGGPIYLDMAKTSSASASQSYNVKLIFDNVARHAALLDMGNNASVTAFVQTLKSTKLPAVDMRAEGMEVHARRDKVLGSLTAAYGTASLIDYTGATGLRTLVDDYRYRFVAEQYKLAGFSAPGRTLNESLSAPVQSMCRQLGWPCWDASLHTRRSVQHSNYDERATCGSGCSGNPWDADWDVKPVGWGEAHELGHNMQISKLNIMYGASEAAYTSWTGLVSRSGENSNNIFPYYIMWNYYRNYKAYSGTLTDGHMNGKDAFACLQSAYANLTSGTGYRVLASACAVLGTYSASTYKTSASRHFEGAYGDSGDYEENGIRMAFYLQIPLLVAANPTAYGGVKLTYGWPIFTLLYQAARQLDSWGGSSSTVAVWDANRGLLGMDLFPLKGNSSLPYTSTESVASKITGNDFMVMLLSFVTARDWRPYFDLRGIRYSWIANKQVQSHVDSGRVSPTSKSDFPFMALATRMPFANMTGIPAVVINGTSTWPLDGYDVRTCS